MIMKNWKIEILSAIIAIVLTTVLFGVIYLGLGYTIPTVAE